MIWLKIFLSPAGLGVLAAALVSGGVMYKAGAYIGHSRGYSEGKEVTEAAQIVADQEKGAEIREGIRDALKKGGAAHSDDDIDSILRGIDGL